MSKNNEVKAPSTKVQLNIEINQDFFTHLHELMGWTGREPNHLEHLKNALELYAAVIEGMSEGHVPALVEPRGMSAEKIYLPSLLSQLKYEKEMEFDKKIDLRKGIL